MFISKWRAAEKAKEYNNNKIKTLDCACISSSTVERDSEWLR